jgi:hypothetical protein
MRPAAILAAALAIVGCDQPPGVVEEDTELGQCSTAFCVQNPSDLDANSGLWSRCAEEDCAELEPEGNPLATKSDCIAQGEEKGCTRMIVKLYVDND